MQRRNFLGVLGGAVAWPLAARAQQPTMPVIGLLGSASADESTHIMRALRAGRHWPSLGANSSQPNVDDKT